MSDKKRVPVEDLLVNLTRSEYTVDELVEWLADVNRPSSHAKFCKYVRAAIDEAIKYCEIPIITRRYPFGIEKEELLSKDIKPWCDKKGLIFAPDSKPAKVNKSAITKRENNLISIALAKGKLINSFMKGEKLPSCDYLVKSTHGNITPGGLGTYLTDHFGAPKSTRDKLREIFADDDDFGNDE